MSTIHLRIMQFTWSIGYIPTSCRSKAERKNTTYNPINVTCKHCIETEQYKILISKQIARRMKG